MRRFASFLAALCLLGGVLVPQRAHAQTTDSLFLRPGDVIRLVVFRQPDLSGEFTVSPEGTIQHPLLNQVSVVNASRSEIRERLRVALSRYDREPAFVFDALYRVAVGGEVRLPSLYSLSPETTLGEAIAAAGGIGPSAKLNDVHLLRNGQDIRLDLRRPDPEVAAMHIRSGDQLLVGRGKDLLTEVIGPLGAVLGALGAIANLLRH
jgi:protein involved in polysaccharide export with SLBB domain